MARMPKPLSLVLQEADDIAFAKAVDAAAANLNWSGSPERPAAGTPGWIEHMAREQGWEAKVKKPEPGAVRVTLSSASEADARVFQAFLTEWLPGHVSVTVVPSDEAKRGCPECPAGLGERCGDDCPRVRRYKATRCKAIPVRGSKLTATKGEWKLATGFEGCSIHEDEPHDTHLFAEDFRQWRWGNEPEYVYCAVCECRIRDVGPAGLQCVRLLGSDRLGHVCDTCAKIPAADLEWHGDRLVPKTKREPVVVWSYLGVTSKVGWRDGGERFPTEFYVEFADAPSMACPDCGAAPNARAGCPGCRPPGCEKCVTPHEEGGHYCSPECVRQATEVLRGKRERRTVPLAALTRALRAALPVIAPTWDACDRKPLHDAAHEACEIGEAAGDTMHSGPRLQPMLTTMLGILAAATHLGPVVATEQARKVLADARKAFPRRSK